MNDASLTGAAIAAEGLRLVKGRHPILEIPAFTVRRGQVLALVGPNGAGKSSLLQVLALLQRPTAGRVLVAGETATRANNLALRRRMAVVFQDALLLDTTVRENVILGLKLRGVPRAAALERAQAWLERLGIAHLADRPARFLSGGEAQRTSLARAFALEPEVLFLDEPFSALDYPTRVGLLREMGDILKGTGITTVFVTHDYTEIPYLTRDVAVLRDGRLIREGDVEELFGIAGVPSATARMPWENG
ncbi:MAG: ATP-binding cassette domain-containing protein [Bacillota bacterium]|nr:ATP-binding cassette domain-containing protein [Bacillota bacterium]